MSNAATTHNVNIEDFEAAGTLYQLELEVTVNADPGLPAAVLAYSLVEGIVEDDHGAVRFGGPFALQPADDSRLRALILEAVAS